MLGNWGHQYGVCDGSHCDWRYDLHGGGEVRDCTSLNISLKNDAMCVYLGVVWYLSIDNNCMCCQML